MSDSNSHHALIPPVPDDQGRPLWSVMIPTYNCAELLRETLLSVLRQDPGPEKMQIEVVDDCSTRDDPESVVRSLAAERVSFFRQEQNVGHVRNFETCIRRARGHLVHILHGDDLARDGFYARLQAAFEADPSIGAAFCRHIYIDEDGHWQSISPLERATSGPIEGWLHKIASGQRVATPSVVVKREVYEAIGGYDTRVNSAGEDWEMWVRIATRYPVWFEPEPLAAYRMNRKGALTDESGARVGLVRDMRVATEIIGSYILDYLPEKQAVEALNSARKMYSRWAFDGAQYMFSRGHLRNASLHLVEAYRCRPGAGTLASAASVVLRNSGSIVRKAPHYLRRRMMDGPVRQSTESFHASR